MITVPASIRRARWAPASVALVGLSLFLVSCGINRTITPRGAVRLTSTPARLMPTLIDKSGAPARLESGGFVVVEARDDSTLGLHRYSDDLQPGWSVPMMRLETMSSFGFMSSGGRPGIGFGTMFKEVVSAVVASPGGVSVIGYRLGESDSLYAIARRYDAATGRELRNDVLYATVMHGDLDAEQRRAFVAVSPDSSKVLVFNLVPGTDASQYSINARVIDADHTVLRGAIVSLKSEENRTVRTIEVDNDGNIYAVSTVRGADLQVERHALDGTTSSIRTSFGDPSRGVTIGAVVARVDGPNTILVTSPLKSGDDLIGVAMTRLNPLEREPLLKRNFPITETMLEKATGDDEYEFPHMHSIVSTGNGQHVLVLEQRYTREVTSTPYNARGQAMPMSGRTNTHVVVGNILLVGSNEDGTVKWLGHVKREEQAIVLAGFTEGVLFEMLGLGMGAHATADGWLHVLHRDKEGLRLRQFNIADGTQRSTDGEILLDMGPGATANVKNAFWIGDHDVLVPGGSDVPAIYRMNYATR
jgi:hypothetical protein